MKFIKSGILCFIYIFFNYFVCNIPSWTIRRFFYRLGGMKIGKSARILMKVTVVNPWKIAIGDRVVINEYSYLDGRGGIVIENDTSISIYTIILSASHDPHSEEFQYTRQAVFIGKCVWTGARSIILPGSRLEDGCILAAGSVAIRKVYEKRKIYSGVPAKYIGDRKINDLYNLGKWKPWFR